MRVFEGKSKALVEDDLHLTELEEELFQKMKKATVLNDLEAFLDKTVAEADWIVTCQDYYDTRRRTVKINEDRFSISWNETYNKTLASGERSLMLDANERVGFRFTDYGYMPLHNHENTIGNEDVTIDQVLFLWGIIMRDRMKAKLPKCAFSPVYQQLGEATFTYTVPARQWKDWF